MNRIKVLLADDHTIIAEGLSVLLSEHFNLVGIASNGYEMVALARQFQPEVIISDISMPSMSGIEALRILRKDEIRSKFIILTMHEEATLAVEALNAGAQGYVLKRSACNELVDAVNEVFSGQTYVSPLIEGDIQAIRHRCLIRESTSYSPLTMRQREILQLTAEGKKMKEIAEKLNISPRTVESHKYSLMQTLGLKTTAELVQYAIKSHRI